LIADGTTQQFLAGGSKGAFFEFDAANPDGISHVRRSGPDTFAFEDLLGGGDRDFNDAVVQIGFRR
jgi:hypothetical protein